MVKYYAKGTTKEVKVGQTLTVEMNVNTPFGVGRTQVDVVVTQATLEELIKKGLVEKREDKAINAAEILESLKPYIRRFARKHDLDFPKACVILAEIYELSPRAYIQVLLEQISEVKNRGKDKSLGVTVWGLNPFMGYNVGIATKNPCATVFLNRVDAMEAYKLLSPFIEELNNGGK